MKPIFIGLLLLSTYCFSQKQYEFDYLITYDMTVYKDSLKISDQPFNEEGKTLKKYYLTNSKKNNYVAVITELDSLQYKIIFKDENGLLSEMNFLKSDLDSAESINIDCKYVSRYGNPYRYQTNNYDFFKLTDTIVNGKTLSQFKLQSIKPRKIKRKKLGTKFYLIDKEASFHLPVFEFSTAYEEWKETGSLPNGILFETFFIDFYGNLSSKQRLKSYEKVNKKFIIDEACDYSKTE
jgi:hypothetical protein